MGTTTSSLLEEARYCYVVLLHVGGGGPRGYLASRDGFGTPLRIDDEGEYAHRYAAPMNCIGRVRGWPVFDCLQAAQNCAAGQPRARIAHCLAHGVRNYRGLEYAAHSVSMGPWVDDCAHTLPCTRC